MNIPEPGNYLVFQEYLDGHGGGQYPVVDLVSIDEDQDSEEPEPGDPREVQGWCLSAGYDGIVFLEFWPNGEVYASGDGFNHARYRVTDIRPVELPPETPDLELTDVDGVPVYWDIWNQDSWDDKPGIKVEFEVHFYKNGNWHLGSRKEFAEDQAAVDRLVAEARAELAKPKYRGLEAQILVAGKVSWSRPR